MKLLFIILGSLIIFGVIFTVYCCLIIASIEERHLEKLENEKNIQHQKNNDSLSPK